LCLRISRIAWCSILSKAFSKSRVKMTISFLEVLQRWRYSKAQPRQSWMDLVLMKPYWFSCISLRQTRSSTVHSLPLGRCHAGLVAVGPTGQWLNGREANVRGTPSASGWPATAFLQVAWWGVWVPNLIGRLA
jgi:hypothetical protein